MIYLAIVAVANVGLAGYLAYEVRRMAYIAMSRHVSDVVKIETGSKKRFKPAEEEGEKTYNPRRTPNEGVGP